MKERKSYESPLSGRYASEEISFLFSPHYKFQTWRKLWVVLAKAQKKLGLPITDSQIRAMEKGANTIDFAKADAYEKKFRHDVMAHIHAFGDTCDEARGIIHLGATSCFVTDNTDLIQMREGLKCIRDKIVQVIRNLSALAKKHAALACLSYTHFQPAQPTTVGKRICLWLQDFLIDFQEIEELLNTFRFLGIKGATGTQASFLTLFGGDHSKVKKLEELLAQEMGFSHLFRISGQTYTRKQDIQVLNRLSSFAASAHKCATDIRLLCHLKEFSEPFGEKQVGSSAMPHKRNPIHTERICGLSRFLISLQENALYTEATQWLERTLDDSANRRLYIPDAFLTADAILNLLCYVTAGLTVHPSPIEKHLQEEIPFLSTEIILMEAVKRGKDRQKVHERLRQHTLKTKGDLLEMISQDKEIGLSKKEIEKLLQVKHFIGRSIEQTTEFLGQEVTPLLNKYRKLAPFAAEVPV